MERDVIVNQIPDNATVYGADGEKVGTVIAVTPGYIVVEKGFFFPTDYYIPRSMIGSLSGNDVTLVVNKNDALNQGWDAQPADLNTAVAATGVASSANTVLTQPADDVVTSTYATGDAVPVAGAAPLSDTTWDETDTTAASATATTRAVTGRDQTRLDDSDRVVVPIREEELVATKRSEEIGSVRLEKVVTQEDKSIDVPVSEERVRVTRRVVDRVEGAADNGADAFEETVIEVPLYGEDVDVTRRTRVVGEVEIDKEKVDATRHVAGTVRREDVRVVDNVNEGYEGVIDDETAVIDPRTDTMATDR